MIRCSALAWPMLWLVGCSVLVEPDSLSVRCEIEEVADDRCPRDPEHPNGPPSCLIDPCHAAERRDDGTGKLHCEAGACRPCHPRAEQCNQIDDDCNGLVDDWQFGINVCDAIHRCTGDDDDPPECAEPACTPGSCGTGETCDHVTRRCVTPAPLGMPCNREADCPGGTCIHAAALGITGGGSFCGKACCSDATCESGVCYAPGTGARACVPIELTGDMNPEARCTAHDDCISGVCLDGTCQSVCTAHSDCPSGGACVFQATSGAVFMRAGQFVCGERAGGTAGGTACNRFFDTCASGLCLDVGFAAQCADPCGHSGDCGEATGRCAYRDTSWLGSNSRVAVCVEPGDGTATAGANCDSHEDCRDGDCINRTCVQVCCHDEHCPYGQRCRALQHLGRWQMICLPG